MQIIIVGEDKLMYFLTKMFLSKGHKVINISNNSTLCELLAKRTKSLVLEGNGSDPSLLEQAEAGIADCLVAITPRDEDNLVICQIAKVQFKMHHTLALVNDCENEVVFQKLGYKAVSTTNLLVKTIEQMTIFDSITNLLPMAEGKVHITEVKLISQVALINKQIQNILLPKGVLIACILREEEPFIPCGETILKEKDQLLVITTSENHAAAMRLLAEKD